MIIGTNILKKILAKLIQQYTKKLKCHNQRILSRYAKMVEYMQITMCYTISTQGMIKIMWLYQ